jgi:hypothetical protein
MNQIVLVKFRSYWLLDLEETKIMFSAQPVETF